ncbi:copia protein [Tanacetum coccineum]
MKTSSTSLIIVDEHEAPPIVTTSDEKTSPISLSKVDEFNQKVFAHFDGNSQFVSYNPPSHEEIESSTTALEPSNVQNFHQISENKCDAENIVVPNKLVLWQKDSGRRRHDCFEESFALVARFEGRSAFHYLPWLFIRQSQYAIELLKKHGLDECVSMSIPMAIERLDADLQGTPTDQTTYCRMIGGLMYLTASHPDIAFATFVCARYQAYADHAGCKDDCKSTSGGLQFLGGKLSQPTESTQGKHRTPSAPRSPNPKMDIAESSALKQSTVIHFCLPKRRSTRLTPPALVPTVDKADEMILQDTLQVSLAEHKGRVRSKKLKKMWNWSNKHLASEDIEKMMEGSENVIDASLPPRIDETQYSSIA